MSLRRNPALVIFFLSSVVPSLFLASGSATCRASDGSRPIDERKFERFRAQSGRTNRSFLARVSGDSIYR